jgi:hypothetical protein
MGGGDQCADSAQQGQTFHVRRSLMQAIENLAAGIIGRDRIYITANGLARCVHAREDRELRIRGKQHHCHHQDGLRNNGSVMRSSDNRDHQKDQSAEESYPVQTHQGTADNQTGSVDACRGSGKERRKLAEGDGSKNGAKENQRAQPKAKHQVNQEMEEGSHLGYKGARPVSRSIRRAIGG